MASISKRGDYQYQATVRRKGFRTQHKTFETERDAKNWAKVIESEMIRGVFLDRSQLERTTLASCSTATSEKSPSAKSGLDRSADHYP